MNQLKTLILKELHHLFASPIVYIFTAVFLILNNFFYFNNFFLAGQASMRSFFTNFPLTLIFFVSLLSMSSFSTEKKSGTLEILLSLPVKKTTAVLAKFIAVLSLFTFTLIFTLPTVATLLSLGKPDLGPIFTSYLGSLLLVSLYASVGIFISALIQEQIISFLLSAGILLTFYLAGVEFVLERTTFLLQIILTIVSPASHFENFASGVVYPKDIIYFLSLTLFFLWLAGKKVGFEK